MRIVITLKDPDGIYESFNDAAYDLVSPEQANDDYEQDFEDQRQKLLESARDFIEYQEYVRLEFDTETKHVRVLTRKEW